MDFIEAICTLFTFQVAIFENLGASNPVACVIFVDFIIVNIVMIIKRFIEETF